MKFFIFFIFFCFSLNCESQKTVVIDIDETLCWSTKDQELADQISENQPEMTRIDDLESHPGVVYFFPKYTEFFLRFLLQNDFKIVIFSAGIEARNEELMRKVLEVYFDPEECSSFFDTQQFNIYSRDSLYPALSGDEIIDIDAVENRTPFKKFPLSFVQKDRVKCLRYILPDQNLNDVILIDDQILNGISYNIVTEYAYFKMNAQGEEYRCFPNTPDAIAVPKSQAVVEDRSELTMIRPQIDTLFMQKITQDDLSPQTQFMLNSALYYTGVLAMAMDYMAENDVSLREAVHALLHQGKSLEEIDLTKQTVFDEDETPGLFHFLARGDAELSQMIDRFLVEDSETDEQDKEVTIEYENEMSLYEVSYSQNISNGISTIQEVTTR